MTRVTCVPSALCRAGIFELESDVEGSDDGSEGEESDESGEECTGTEEIGEGRCSPHDWRDTPGNPLKLPCITAASSTHPLPPISFCRHAGGLLWMDGGGGYVSLWCLTESSSRGICSLDR